jgi:hypothetical protein
MPYCSYANSDYALAQVLRSHKEQPYIVWSYDIECQNAINRVTRFEKWFPDLVDVAKWIVGCIHKYTFRTIKMTANITICLHTRKASSAHVKGLLRLLGPRAIRRVAVQKNRTQGITTITWIISTVMGKVNEIGQVYPMHQHYHHKF